MKHLDKIYDMYEISSWTDHIETVGIYKYTNTLYLNISYKHFDLRSIHEIWSYFF